MPVIGFLNPQSADDSKNFNVAVLQGLKVLGVGFPRDGS
jgi:hypothetical protein